MGIHWRCIYKPDQPPALQHQGTWCGLTLPTSIRILLYISFVFCYLISSFVGSILVFIVFWFVVLDMLNCLIFVGGIMGIIQSHDPRPTRSFTLKNPPIDGTLHEILEIGEIIARRKSSKQERTRNSCFSFVDVYIYTCFFHFQVGTMFFLRFPPSRPLVFAGYPKQLGAHFSLLTWRSMEVFMTTVWRWIAVVMVFVNLPSRCHVPPCRFIRVW